MAGVRGPSTGTLSDVGALINMLKGLFGLGILALPFATMKVGWLFSMVGMAIIAALTIWGIVVAVRSRALLMESQGTEEEKLVKRIKSSPDAEQQGEGDEEGVDSGLGFFDNVVLQTFGQKGRCLAIGCILLGQFATGVAYVDVISESTQAYFPGQDVRFPILCVLAVLLSLCSLVKTLSGVAVLSAIALLPYFLIFVGLLGDSARSFQAQTLGDATFALQGASSFCPGMWFGVAQFAFGGLPIAVIIHDEMQEPQNFYKVIGCAFAITWVAYTLFAIIGYMNYGEDTAEVIYFNFESTNMKNASIAAMCACLTFSYALQMYPVYSAAQSWCSRQPSLAWLHYAAVRTVFVLLTIIAAHTFPNIVFVLDVIGGVAGAIISFVLPSLVYLRLKKSPSNFEAGVCWGAVMMGFVGSLKSVGL